MIISDKSKEILKRGLGYVQNGKCDIKGCHIIGDLMRRIKDLETSKGLEEEWPKQEFSTSFDNVMPNRDISNIKKNKVRVKKKAAMPKKSRIGTTKKKKHFWER